ncbi:MAG: hypothetical protein FWD53_02320 [Phycisphaerales bacterium]|nr:hypothetical protein [Phycisphaerales bacterium]
MDAHENGAEKNGEKKDTRGDASRQKYPKNVADEIQKETEKLNSLMKEELAKYPHHAFFDAAAGVFEERHTADFDELAGFALNHSGRSLLMEIALTLMKTITILEAKYSKYTGVATTEEGLKSDHFTRLYLVLRVVEELIERERDGKTKSVNEIKHPSELFLDARKMMRNLIGLSAGEKICEYEE